MSNYTRKKIPINTSFAEKSFFFFSLLSSVLKIFVRFSIYHFWPEKQTTQVILRNINDQRWKEYPWIMNPTTIVYELIGLKHNFISRKRQFDFFFSFNDGVMVDNQLLQEIYNIQYWVECKTDLQLKWLAFKEKDSNWRENETIYSIILWVCAIEMCFCMFWIVHQFDIRVSPDR